MVRAVLIRYIFCIYPVFASVYCKLLYGFCFCCEIAYYTQLQNRFCYIISTRRKWVLFKSTKSLAMSILASKSWDTFKVMIVNVDITSFCLIVFYSCYDSEQKHYCCLLEHLQTKLSLMCLGALQNSHFLRIIWQTGNSFVTCHQKNISCLPYSVVWIIRRCQCGCEAWPLEQVSTHVAETNLSFF